MVDEFGLNAKLCHLDKTPFADNELVKIQPDTYNEKIKTALTSLDKQLPTFAIVDEGLQPEQKLCLLVERGSFWGMGYINSTSFLDNIAELKEQLDPHADNDFIRNSIYSFAAEHPSRKVVFG
jgi:DNA polymerase-3 subunit epsilon